MVQCSAVLCCDACLDTVPDLLGTEALASTPTAPRPPTPRAPHSARVPRPPPTRARAQAKTTKKITLRLECKDCRYKMQLPMKRCKHFEIGAPKKP